MENCQTQDIQLEAADPQAPLRNLFVQYVGMENCQTQDIVEMEVADSQAP